MPPNFPITLVNLAHQLCIVVGGGSVAERKVRALLDAQARVRVIAPHLTPQLAEQAQHHEIEWAAREYAAGDLAGAFLVIVATDDARVNQAVTVEAVRERCLINVVDDPAQCTFFMPAVVRRGDLTIAISTGGDVPALAAHLREQLERQFGEEWEAYVDWLARIRQRVIEQYPEMQTRRQIWQRVLDFPLREYIQTHSPDAIEMQLTRLLNDNALT